ATSAHGVVKRANHLLQHQTVLPTIASAISLIFTRCPCMRPPPQEEFCNEKNGETANEFPVIVRPLLMFPTAWACRRCRHNHFSPSDSWLHGSRRSRAKSPGSTRRAGRRHRATGAEIILLGPARCVLAMPRAGSWKGRPAAFQGAPFALS